jgi:hypothetical protein
MESGEPIGGPLTQGVGGSCDGGESPGGVFGSLLPIYTTEVSAQVKGLSSSNGRYAWRTPQSSYVRGYRGTRTKPFPRDPVGNELGQPTLFELGPARLGGQQSPVGWVRL